MRMGHLYVMRLLPVPRRFLQIDGISWEESQAFESLLRKMVHYKIQDRISADEVEVELVPLLTTV